MHGFDFQETFILVIKLVTIRIVIIVALLRKWKLYQLFLFKWLIIGRNLYDAAFRFEDSRFPSHVIKLQNVIYGLKQTSQTWFDIMVYALVHMGFTKSRFDAFYIHKHHLLVGLC